MDWVQLPVVQLGALGLLLVVLGMVFTGRLMPKPYVDKLLAVLEKRIEEKTSEASEWKKAAESTTAASLESVAQIGELLQTARTTNAIVESLAHHGGEDRDVVAP